MSDTGPDGRPTILVCITCRTAPNVVAADGGEWRPGGVLADATKLAAAGAGAGDISVQRVRCLGNCNRGLSAAIRCENTWSYVFGGLDPQRDAPALVTGARLLAAAADGIMPWSGRPDSLKRGLIARVPPPHFREEPT